MSNSSPHRSAPPSPDVVIVGAGAAGLATAIFTRRANPSCTVALVDGARKPGAKILVSGGGRCNVTNVSVTERDFWGGRSTIVPLETQDELKKTLPKVRIVTMPGLGHYPSDEKPREFLAIVDEFLTANATRQP